RMGHAGAIISGGQGTAAQKMETLRQHGIHVVENIGEIGTETLNAIR
ncbi:MAG: succinate--CoA ligase subunit alpha, partial [Deltaproteobacteria bacterium]|nr:succinate--CoA ligase subunit alpha [Deltaproteobacteria bacterium]